MEEPKKEETQIRSIVRGGGVDGYATRCMIVWRGSGDCRGSISVPWAEFSVVSGGGT